MRKNPFYDVGFNTVPQRATNGKNEAFLHANYINIPQARLSAQLFKLIIFLERLKRIDYEATISTERFCLFL